MTWRCQVRAGYAPGMHRVCAGYVPAAPGTLATHRALPLLLKYISYPIIKHVRTMLHCGSSDLHAVWVKCQNRAFCENKHRRIAVPSPGCRPVLESGCPLNVYPIASTSFHSLVALTTATHSQALVMPSAVVHRFMDFTCRFRTLGFKLLHTTNNNIVCKQTRPLILTFGATGFTGNPCLWLAISTMILVGFSTM